MTHSSYRIVRPARDPRAFARFVHQVTLNAELVSLAAVLCEQRPTRDFGRTVAYLAKLRDKKPDVYKELLLTHAAALIEVGDSWDLGGPTGRSNHA